MPVKFRPSSSDLLDWKKTESLQKTLQKQQRSAWSSQYLMSCFIYSKTFSSRKKILTITLDNFYTLVASYTEGKTFRHGSHIDFGTRCVIMTLAGGRGGYCQWRFENEKSYAISKFMSCYSRSVQVKY